MTVKTYQAAAEPLSVLWYNHRMTVIFRLLLLILLLLPTACAAPDRSAGMLSDGVVLPGEALPADGAVTLVGLVFGRSQYVLSAGPTADGAVLLAPLSAQLRADAGLAPDTAAAGLPIEVRGRVSAEPGGLLLTPVTIDAVMPRSTRLAELAGLSGPHLVQIEADLLAMGGGYLLVSELTEGGVPTAASLQFKLRLTDGAVAGLPPLQAAGAVGIAPVTVLALWRDGLLTGLTVSARAKP